MLIALTTFAASQRVRLAAERERRDSMMRRSSALLTTLARSRITYELVE